MCQKHDVVLDLPVHNFLVLLLLSEDKLVNIFEVLHIIKDRFEIVSHIFFKGS